MNANIFIKIIWVFFIIYFIVLLDLIFFKTQLGTINYHYSQIASRLTLWHNFRLAYFTPLRGIINVILSHEPMAFIFQNTLGNIVCFMPLGFLVPVLLPVTNRLRRIVLVGLALSFIFETIQLFGFFGNFDVDDMILNTAGTALGFYCLSRTKLLIKRHLNVSWIHSFDEVKL